MNTATSCRHCGAALRTDAGFCTQCGNPAGGSIAAMEEPLAPKAGHRAWPAWTLVGLGLAASALLVLVALDQGGGPALPPAPAVQAGSGQSPGGHAMAGLRQPRATDPAASERSNRAGLDLARQGRMKEASRAFAQAVRLNPGNAGAWNNLGLTLRRLGRAKEAVAAYQRAIAAAPGFALAHKNLGLALESLGRPRQAAGALLRYCELAAGAEDAGAVRAYAQDLLKSKSKVTVD